MMLYDPYKRRIDYLRVSVTDRCNLSCSYCKPLSGLKVLPHREILSYEEILRLVSVAALLGITRVRVTGGEPLVRRGIIDFIAALAEQDGLEDLSITTNGVLLEEMAQDLFKAGKPRLNISLDSLKRHTFREITGSDDYDRVRRGIDRAEELGFFPLKINMVPVKGINDGEVADFARLTLDRRIHVRFIEYMPLGAAARRHADACVHTGAIKTVIEREIGPLKPFYSDNSAGPSDNYQLPNARGVIGFISPMTRHFCGSCRRLRLTADGKIRPCLLSDTEIDVKSPLRGGCGDPELERLFRLALEVKPDRHYVSETSPVRFQRTMSRIGG
jgi:cyclic pyranopterin phosphate synthase